MSLALGAIYLGATAVGAIAQHYMANKAPELNNKNSSAYDQETANMQNANTLEKNAEEASKLSAQQGGVAGAAAQAQARTANMSRAASAQIGANAASQNILNGYGQNFNTVAGFKNQQINNRLNIGNSMKQNEMNNYNSDSAKWGAQMGAISAGMNSAAQGIGAFNQVPAATAVTQANSQNTTKQEAKS